MKPGDRVRYHGWRGDDGEGTLIGFVRRGVVMERAPSDWGERRVLENLTNEAFTDTNRALLDRARRVGVL